MLNQGMITYMAARLATSSTAIKAMILSAVVTVMTFYMEMKIMTLFLAIWARI